jgi:hypothetical protein
VNAREVDEAASRLAWRRRQAVESGLLSLAVAVLAVPAFLLSTGAGLACMAGAVVQAGVALYAHFDRRGLRERLALEPEAYVIPEVAEFGREVASVRERRRLAEWIREIVRNPYRPGALCVASRIRRFARELDALARDLASPAMRVNPVSAVAVRRLLTYAGESPLYNPRLSDEDLAAALRRIRSGFLNLG